MSDLIIGDFRSLQLQQYQNSSADITLDYLYLLDDAAEYSWFSTNAIAQLPLMSLTKTNVIIMLGFNDCVYSCVWKVFNIESIAQDYANRINELIEQYPSLNFYVCSVNSVDADYPFAEHKNGIIPKKDLDKKINSFNKIIKNKDKCSAEYIDCNKYLIETGFSTRDGVRYTADTCKSLLSYISCNVRTTGYDLFIPRLEAPVVNSDDIESDRYWISNLHNKELGLNLYGIPSLYQKSPADTLPNCTSYAWGRFYEITGEQPKLPVVTAEEWYDYAHGYKKGQEPALGAVICWEGSGIAAGHVAIVEKINEDGSIITSESGLESPTYWWLSKRINDNGHWYPVEISTDNESDWSNKKWTKITNVPGNYNGVTYKFQGFIYCPATSFNAIIEEADKTATIAKSEALTRSEMESNAKYIWNYLGAKGWSLNAVAGLLGNMQYESSINPGRQQVGGTGFGLVQWTPKEKVTKWLKQNNYAEDDIEGQLARIIWEKDNNEQYRKDKYKYTFEEFSVSLDSPYILACAFAFDYERSKVTLKGTEAEKETLRRERGSAAEEWYNFLRPSATRYGDSVQEEFKKMVVEDYKINKTPSAVSASFLVKNANKAQYLLYTDSSKTPIKKSLPVSKSKDSLQIISFSCENLIPNTAYTLDIEIIGDDEKNIKTKSHSFNTPQSHPNPAKSIKLKCLDKIKSPNSTFILDVEMPDNTGCWKSPSYEKQLIVNNECVKTKTIKNIKDIKSEKFTIENEFGYKCKTGDTIQICIRIFTIDNMNKEVYSLDSITSEAVCLLNSPIQTYLNI